jgi:outer membrane protein assembly factor BamB
MRSSTVFCLQVAAAVLVAACGKTAAGPDAAVTTDVSADDAADDAVAAAHVPSCAASRDDAPPWARCAWGPYGEAASAVAFDPATGDLVVTGDMERETVFDGATQHPDGEEDAFLARYSATGKLLALKHFGGPFVKGNTDHAQRVAIAADGSVFVAGTYGGDMDLGADCKLAGDQISNHADRRELFVARFTSDFTCVWAKRGVSQDFDEVADLALLPNQTGLVVSGYIGIGGFGLANGSQGFLAAFALDGTPRWGVAGSPTEPLEYPGAIATASDGRVAWVAATPAHDSTFGGFAVHDGSFIATLAADGGVTAVRQMPGNVLALAFRADGGLTAVAQTTTSADLGNGVLFDPTVSGSSFVVRYAADATTLDVVPLQLLPAATLGERSKSSATVSILADGSIVAAMHSLEATAIGAYPIAATSGATVLAHYGADGKPLAVLGPWPHVGVNHLAVGASAALALAGYYFGDSEADGLKLEATPSTGAATTFADLLVLRMTLP